LNGEPYNIVSGEEEDADSSSLQQTTDGLASLHLSSRLSSGIGSFYSGGRFLIVISY